MRYSIVKCSHINVMLPIKLMCSTCTWTVESHAQIKTLACNPFLRIKSKNPLNSYNLSSGESAFSLLKATNPRLCHKQDFTKSVQDKCFYLFLICSQWEPCEWRGRSTAGFWHQPCTRTICRRGHRQCHTRTQEPAELCKTRQLPEH